MQVSSTLLATTAKRLPHELPHIFFIFVSKVGGKRKDPCIANNNKDKAINTASSDDQENSVQQFTTTTLAGNIGGLPTLISISIVPYIYGQSGSQAYYRTMLPARTYALHCTARSASSVWRFFFAALVRCMPQFKSPLFRQFSLRVHGGTGAPRTAVEGHSNMTAL